MKDLARRARIKILYDNKDISKDLAQYLKSFSYNDVISGQAVNDQGKCHLLGG